MSAGYSGTPLAKKLGIRDDHTVALLAEPDGFRDMLDPLPDRVRFTTSLRGSADVVVFFATRRSALARRIEAAGRAIRPDGGLWVAWPKRSSQLARDLETDMTEDVVRDLALPLGLVDNKVCAIDETWSGLRVVWRRELR